MRSTTDQPIEGNPMTRHPLRLFAAILAAILAVLVILHPEANPLLLLAVAVVFLAVALVVA